MANAIRLLQLGSAVGRDVMAVDMADHGDLGGIGIKNTMVTLLVASINRRLGRICTNLYVENGKGVRS